MSIGVTCRYFPWEPAFSATGALCCMHYDRGTDKGLKHGDLKPSSPLLELPLQGVETLKGGEFHHRNLFDLRRRGRHPVVNPSRTGTVAVGMVNTMLPGGGILLSVLLLLCAGRGATKEVGNVSRGFSLSCACCWCLEMRLIFVYVGPQEQTCRGRHRLLRLPSVYRHPAI